MSNTEGLRFRRTCHPSQQQLDVLLNHLEKHPDIAKGYLKHACALRRTRKFWLRMELLLNEMGGSSKTSKQWMKYWTDKKSATKKKALQFATSAKNNGLSGYEIQLSTAEERILALMCEPRTNSGPTVPTRDYLDYISTLPNQDGVKLEDPLVVVVTEDIGNNLLQENDPEPMESPNSERGAPESPRSNKSDQDKDDDNSATKSSMAVQYPNRQSRVTTNSSRDSEKASMTNESQIQFAKTMEHIIRLEERRINMEDRNARLMRDVLTRSSQVEQALLAGLSNLTDKMYQQNAAVVEAFKSVGEGLKALSDAVRSNNRH